VKVFRTLPVSIWVLLGLLAVAAAVLALGRQESWPIPDSTSYAPSGTRAFADLLRSEGFLVRSIRQSSFRLYSDELAIAIAVDGAGTSGSGGVQRFEGALREHLEKGGSALVGRLNEDFRAESLAALAGPTTVEFSLHSELLPEGTNEAYSVSLGETPQWDYSMAPFGLFGDGVAVWGTNSGVSFAELHSVGKGSFLFVKNGLGATNRFLDRAENADFYLLAVRMLAPKGSRIAFLEAAHTDTGDPSLTEVLGPWAVAGWSQVLVLFGVIVFTLGKRFGEADAPRERQVGSRELADAVSSLLARSRANDLALKKLVEDSDRRVRAHLKIPRDASTAKRDERLPPSLADAFSSAEAASKERVPKGIALKASSRLQREVEAFLGTRGGRRSYS
jgi:hypothetical protein